MHRAEDRRGSHSAGQADAERSRRELSWRLRDECLNVSWFWNLFDARKKIAAWRTDYKTQRPHSALRYLTPEEFARRAASPCSVSDSTRPALPQGFPDGSAIACTPAPALTQIRSCGEGLRRRRSGRLKQYQIRLRCWTDSGFTSLGLQAACKQVTFTAAPSFPRRQS